MVAVAIAIAVTAPVRAEESARVTATLSFAAPARCGDARAFAVRVERHGGGRVRFERGAPMRVRVVRRARGYVGSLEGIERTARAVRSFEGATCESVVDALALVVAMTVVPREPEARSSNVVAANDVAADDGASTAERSPPAAARGAEGAGAPSTEAVPEAPFLVPDRSVEGVLAGFGVNTALLDDGSPVGADASIAWAPVRADRWLVAQELAFSGRWLTRTFTPTTRVDVTRLSANARLCLVRSVAQDLLLDLCSSLEVGRLSVSPSGFTTSGSDAYPWFAIRFLPRARWNVGESLSVSLGPEIDLPFSRPLYMGEVVAGASQQIYRPPVGSVSATLAILWRVR